MSRAEIIVLVMRRQAVQREDGAQAGDVGDDQKLQDHFSLSCQEHADLGGTSACGTVQHKEKELEGRGGSQRCGDPNGGSLSSSERRVSISWRREQSLACCLFYGNLCLQMFLSCSLFPKEKE